MNTTATSQSNTRYEQAVTEQAYASLSEYPNRQAEAIARHYVSNLRIALTLLELIKSRPHGESGRKVDSIIAHCVEEIKRNHRFTLGLKLEWPVHPAPEFKKTTDSSPWYDETFVGGPQG